MPRAFAIIIELLILAAITFCLLWGVRLILFDLLLGPRYKKVITMLLAAVGGVLLVFFIGHLTAFYPALPG
jgi:succinate dehydrogenase/fumarate reductase cytochrome b subunit